MFKKIVMPAVLFILGLLLTIKMSPLAWLSLIAGLVMIIIALIKSKARKKLEASSTEFVGKENLGNSLLFRAGLALLLGPVILVAAALFMLLTNNDLLKKTPLAMAGSPSSANVPFGPNGVPVTVTKPASNITNYEAQGNLESTNNVGCVGSDKLSRKFTPPDMYKAAAICAQQDMNKEGTFLVALAGAYGQFDTLRVVDKSAHNAPNISRMTSFGSLDASKRNTFQANMKATFSDSDTLAAICNDVIRIGPPDYFPRYMIQHGMGAFIQDPKAGNGLVEGFDASAAWSQTLGGYLHCAGYVAQQQPVKNPPATPQATGNNKG
ncbi:MAG: hypothetical protein Q8O64_11215 [Sideroxyarcus sp.]|nr:hypothetical protein [Sideroxyarcus sp.]